jgi:hypothetical protein
MASRYKVVVYVPVTHADAVREAIGQAHGGEVGRYSFCSFSTKGVGRFKPGAGARPAIGSIGTLEEVDEKRIEVTCAAAVVRGVTLAIRRVHPYEEIAMDCYPLEEVPDAPLE